MRETRRKSPIFKIIFAVFKDEQVFIEMFKKS